MATTVGNEFEVREIIIVSRGSLCRPAIMTRCPFYNQIAFGYCPTQNPKGGNDVSKLTIAYLNEKSYHNIRATTTWNYITSCMSFVADLRDAIHGFHFVDRRLSQIPTPQAASSSSYNHRAGQRCFCLWGFISDSL